MGVVNVVVGAIHRPWALRRAELVVVYIIMILANGTHTLLLSWVCVMPAYFYYATPENNWAVLIHPYILDWLVVQDPEAIKPFYEASEGDSGGVPWQAWLGPLMSWLPLIIALHVGTLSLMVVLRRQWVERERLIYPLVQVPLAMIQDDERGSLIKPFFRSGVMWTGFSVTFLIGAMKGLHTYYPFMPSVDLGTSLPLFQGVAIHTEISFATVGFFILIHREIAFSLWVFSLLNIIQKGLYGVFGIGWAQEPALSVWSYNIPDLVHQSMGGMIVLVLGGFWVGRDHLGQVLRKALGRADQVDDSDEIISYRGAVVGLVGSSLILVLWLWLSGIPLLATLTFLFFVLVVFVSLTRTATEGGVAVIYPPLVPPDAAMSAIGTAPFGTQGLVSLLFTRIWANDILNYAMPHCANGLKLGEEIGQRRRWLFAVMLLAIFFGLAGGLWALLHLAYEYGALNLRPKIFNWLPSYYADFAAARVQGTVRPGLVGMVPHRNRRRSHGRLDAGAAPLGLVAPAPPRLSHQLYLQLDGLQRLPRLAHQGPGGQIRRPRALPLRQALLPGHDPGPLHRLRSVLGHRLLHRDGGQRRRPDLSARRGVTGGRCGCRPCGPSPRAAAVHL